MKRWMGLLLFTFVLFYAGLGLYSQDKSAWEAFNKKYPLPEDAVQLKSLFSFPSEELKNKGIFFWQAQHMNMDQSGRIFVSDSKHNKIFCFDSNGDYLFQFGRSGQGPGEFERPYAINFYKDQVIIYDNGNKRLQIFDKRGKFIRSVKLQKIYVDFAINNQGKIFAAVLPYPHYDNLIDVFSMDGKRLYSFGEKPADDTSAMTNFPRMDCIGNDSVVVSFWLQPLIRKYSAEGELLKEIKLDHKLARENAAYSAKAAERRKPGQPTMMRSVVKAMRTGNKRIYLIIGVSSSMPARREILSFDSDLNKVNHFWFKTEKYENIYDFILTGSPENLKFYCLVNTGDHNKIIVRTQQ